MNIIYRHYQEGDDAQLADLFNRAFQMNGAGFIRTPKSWNWRYVQSPGFKPEQCFLAEDSDRSKVVGAVYANLIENRNVNGKNYLVGDINDVSCLPDYTGHGIARKLMEQAIDYMEKIGCDLSMLTADYHGFPRSKIYLKLGYKDVMRELVVINSGNLFRLIKDLPCIAAFLPVFMVQSYIPRFLSRIRIKFTPFFKNFSYEIKYNTNHVEYSEAADRIISKYYTGFPGYNRERMIWAHIKVPAKRYRPTYIVIKKNNKIAGGAVLIHQNMYAFKYGLKIRMGIIQEMFIDKAEFNNKRNLHLGYTFLYDKILKAATQRSIGIILMQPPINEREMVQGFKGMNCFMFKGGTVMIKVFKDDIDISQFKKPLYVSTATSTGIP